MSVIFVIGLSALFYPVINGIWLFAVTAISLRRPIGQQQSESLITTNNCKLYILLPAYKEQKIVKETIDWFTNICPKTLTIQVLIVTNSVEDAAASLSDTTYAIVKDELKKAGSANLFRHLHYSGGKRGKSMQLNFALETLMEEGVVSDNDYIAVYDFDARPAPETFDNFFEIVSAEGGMPDIVQQPVLPVDAYERTSLVGQSDSLLHVLHAYGREIFTWKYSAKVPLFLRKIFFDIYCIGTGLFIRVEKLKKIDGFPMPVDDLPIGFYAAVHDWSFGVIDAHCETQAYPEFKSATASRRIVFHAYIDYLFNRGLCKIGWERFFSGTARTYYITSIGFLLWLTSAVGFFYKTGSLILPFYAFLSYVLVKASHLYFARRIVLQKTGKNLKISIGNIFYACFYWCWRALPALLGAFSYVQKDGYIEISKTDRV